MCRYSIILTIENYDFDKKESIIYAARDFWSFGVSISSPELLELVGEDELDEKKTEVEFLKDLVEAVWEQNEGYCDVEAQVTYLEEAPYKFCNFSREQYDEFISKDKPINEGT